MRGIRPHWIVLAAACLWAAPAMAAPDPWFPVGEEIVYRVYWGIIPVAKTRVTSAWEEVDGRRLIALRFRTRTNRFADRLYPVDDLIETWIDPASFKSVRQAKRMVRRKLLCDEVATFDYETLTAQWRSRCSGETHELALKPESRDLTTLMYYMRSQPFEPGTERVYSVVADGKLWDLTVRVAGIEGVALPAYGRVRSIRLEPEAAFQGVFDLSGRTRIWISDDPRRLCTRMTSRVAFANVRVVLCRVTGPGEDRWTQSADEEAHAAECVEEPAVERDLEKPVPAGP
ncbi:MAG: DUF3108 domain-containing protein [Kiritimatiellae bacterium]|nr:DUF3108 domain-containing protein [Kiritimatiellia bacterium]